MRVFRRERQGHGTWIGRQAPVVVIVRGRYDDMGVVGTSGGDD